MNEKTLARGKKDGLQQQEDNQYELKTWSKANEKTFSSEQIVSLNEKTLAGS